MAKFVVTIEDSDNGQARVGFEVDDESKKLLGNKQLPQTPAGVIFAKFMATFKRSDVVSINGSARNIRGKGRKRGHNGPRGQNKDAGKVYDPTKGRGLTDASGKPLSS